MRKCSAGASPPQGSRWGVAESAVPSHNFNSSYLSVPAPAGMSDCYVNMSRTTIRDRPLRQPLIGHSRHPFVIPAIKSMPRTPIRGRNTEGIGRGDCSAGACPQLRASHHFHPLMRPSQGHGDSGGSRNPGVDGGNCVRTPPINSLSFHTLVCRLSAGMSDYYESISRSPIRDRLSNQFQRQLLPT